ncbi:TMEM165/GDT1 family protein [Actinomadura sp. HBU206391]|uniref:TMEM165/GDT1 family protein n=1 Tax=Actinomadura sp. HBU206391 TaxID=2731692 RepID=UPI00164FA0A0|nr:TMEM165/GDT1 family protein [Actinomadura sp. HBU206391]MBC6458960.1 TMEM165/GDT1 family protein [Actinomadura sp. HBU206391]
MSYLALCTLFAVLVGAFFASGVPTRLSTGPDAALCLIFHQNCQPEGSFSGLGNTSADRYKTAQSTNPGKGGDGNCWTWADRFCQVVDGVRLGVWDTFKDIWDGVRLGGCLAHNLCKHSDFKSSWVSIYKLFTTNPVDTGSSMLDEATKPIRDDWNNERKLRAVTRAAPSVASVIFGGKGITKIGKVGKAGKAGKRVDEVKPRRDTPTEKPILLELAGRQALEQLSKQYGDTVLYHGSPTRLTELEPRQMNWLDKDLNKYPDGKPAVCAGTCYDVPIFMALFKKRARFRYKENANGETEFIVDKASLTEGLEDLEGYVYIVRKVDFESFGGEAPEGWPGPALPRPEEYRAYDKVTPLAMVKVTIEDFPATIVFE